MKSLVQTIQEYSDKKFLDEDGNSVFMILKKGITTSEIAEFENKRNVVLPSELKDLLLFSNGLGLFGLCILPLEDMEFFSEEKFVCFHNWGNGDFDCISVNSEYSNDEIIFINHSINNRTIVAPSLLKWINQVIEEIKSKGALLHPIDYSNRVEDGMYKKVLKN